jgi:protein gp37
MGEFSNIEWTDHTWNPWIGCQHVSPGCDHCYAETMNARYKWNGGEWGPHGPRKRTSEANWRKPLQWDKAAKADGVRLKVFCASLADWLDNKAERSWRADLGKLVAATPHLDWLLLTKRIENYERFAPWSRAPRNVWLGVTCENQQYYDRRWAILSEIGAETRFISYEPALGPLTIAHQSQSGVPDWVICGGESGAGARTMKRRWARDLRDECEELGVAFFMKQMTAREDIPSDLLVRQFPNGQH